MVYPINENTLFSRILFSVQGLNTIEFLKIKSLMRKVVYGVWFLIYLFSSILCITMMAIK